MGDSDDIWFPSVLFSDSRADRLLCETHPHLFFFYPGKSRYFLFHKDSQQVGCSFFRKQFLSLFSSSDWLFIRWLQRRVRDEGPTWGSS